MHDLAFLLDERFALAADGDRIPQHSQIDILRINAGNQCFDINMPLILAEVDQRETTGCYRRKECRSKRPVVTSATESFVDFPSQIVQLFENIPGCHVDYLLSICDFLIKK